MSKSIAKYIFQNYFEMLAKAGIDSAMDNMEMYVHKIESGDTLESIAKFDYTVKASDTVQSIVDTFGVSESEIIEVNDTVENHFAAGTTIKIPVDVSPLQIIKANTSTKGIIKGSKKLHCSGKSMDTTQNTTFGEITSYFNISTEQLCSEVTVGETALKDSTELLETDGMLNIPSIPVITVAKLKERILRSGDLNSAAAMTSASMLSGQRMPNPADYDENETFPLYSLAGQQVREGDMKEFTEGEKTLKGFTLKKEGNSCSFVNLNGGTSIDVKLDDKHQEQMEILDEITFTPDVVAVRRLPLFTYVAEQFALAQKHEWNETGIETRINCLKNMNDKVAEIKPDIWMFPEGLRSKIADRSVNDKLFYQILKNRHENPGTPHKTEDLESYCYATTIELFTQQIPGMDGTHLLEGTDEKGFRILDDIQDYISKNSGTEAELFLLYETKDGFSSGTIREGDVKILRTNLSKENKENQALPSIAEMSNFSDFVNVIYNCTESENGGFYMVINSEEGIPVDVFEEKGGKLKLVMVMGKHDEQVEDKKLQNRLINRTLLPFNNCAIVGDNIDINGTQLIIEPLTHRVEHTDKLSDILLMDEYENTNLEAVDIVKLNKNIKKLLIPGMVITVNGSAITIKQGETIENIRTQLTPTVDDTDPDYKNKIEQQYKDIADAIKDKEILEAGSIIQFADNAVHMVPTVAPGNVGFEVIVTDPTYTHIGRESDAADNLTFQMALDQIKDLPGLIADKAKISCNGTSSNVVSSNYTIADYTAQGFLMTLNKNVKLSENITFTFNMKTVTTNTSDITTLEEVVQAFKNQFSDDNDKNKCTLEKITSANSLLDSIFKKGKSISDGAKNCTLCTTTFVGLADIFNSTVENIAEKNKTLPLNSEFSLKLDVRVNNEENCETEELLFSLPKGTSLESALAKTKRHYNFILEYYRRFHLLGFNIAGKEGLPISPAVNEKKEKTETEATGE